MKRPSFQFYPADWRKDVALQACSLAAQGLWVNIMCLAHECEPYGHLALNGKPMTTAQIAKGCGTTPKECEALLGELEDAGVSSKTENGFLFSRRMVRDEALRDQRAETGRANGAKGAEFGAKGAEHGKKGGRPKANNPGNDATEEPGQKPPQNPHPSSSSSSSTSKAFPETTTGVDLAAGIEHDPPLPSSSSENLSKRTLDIVLLLRDRGVRIVPGNEFARQWATNGVTDAQLLTAAEQAEAQRQAKKDPNPVNAGYLNAVLTSVVKDHPAYDFDELAKLL